jgi:RNA 3'-terminal phosphate cyclase (ATP)
LGERGKRAERVADEAVSGLAHFLPTDATVDEYAADQLLLPLCLAPGLSEYKTPRVTQHLLTNAEVISRFLPVTIEIEGDEGKPGTVRVTP